jgi:hypothetical protein
VQAEGSVGEEGQGREAQEVVRQGREGQGRGAQGVRWQDREVRAAGRQGTGALDEEEQDREVRAVGGQGTVAPDEEGQMEKQAIGAGGCSPAANTATDTTLLVLDGGAAWSGSGGAGVCMFVSVLCVRMRMRRECV